MAYYSLSDKYILKMPIERFWLLSQQIDRFNAIDDSRRMNVAAAVQASDSFREMNQDLTEKIGVIVVRDYAKDADSIKDLKRSLLK